MNDAAGRRAWAAVFMALLVTPACGDSASEVPCDRPCPFGFECQRVDGGQQTTCVEATLTCDPPCGAVEQCVVTQCLPVDRTLSCAEALTCLGDCDAPGDCADRCEARTKFGDVALLGTLDTCLEDNSCADTACAQAQCGDALAACLATDTGCGDVGSAGQCEGEQLSYCENNRLITGDCRSVAPGCTCGLDTARQIFDCLCPGAPCVPACPANATCVDGMCQLGGFGGCSGLPNGQSVCQGSVLIACNGGQLAQQDCAAFSCTCGPDPNQPGQAACCP